MNTSLAPSTSRSSFEPGTRLRTSCDACQNLKMKCSQDKPSCYRCSKNGLTCVYSPLRRMGRPKTKRPAESGSTISSPSTMTARKYQRRSCAAPSSSSPLELLPSAGTPVAVEAPGMNEMESWSRDTGMEYVMASGVAAVPVEGVDGAVNGTSEGATGSAQCQQQAESQKEVAAGSYCPSAFLNDTPDTGLLASNEGLPISSSLPPSSTSAFQKNGDTKSHMGHSNPLEQNSPFSATLAQVDGSERKEPDEENGQEHCYMRILRRLTQLEQTLERSPSIPPLDIILSAERDTRLLRDGLFACRGHPQHPSNTSRLVTVDSERSHSTAFQSCLQAHSSSVLVLVILADRVTNLLERLFHHAAASSYNMHKAFQTSSAFLLLESSSELSNDKAEWRTARSLRGSFPRSINCPVPEASCRLTVGMYEVDNEVESRVTKQILRRRVRALHTMLGDVEDYLEPASGWRLPSCTSQNGQGHPEGEGATTLLGDKDDKLGLPSSMARSMVLDVRRRVELLQGRLELAD